MRALTWCLNVILFIGNQRCLLPTPRDQACTRGRACTVSTGRAGRGQQNEGCGQVPRPQALETVFHSPDSDAQACDWEEGGPQQPRYVSWVCKGRRWGWGTALGPRSLCCTQGWGFSPSVGASKSRVHGSGTSCPALSLSPTLAPMPPPPHALTPQTRPARGKGQCPGLTQVLCHSQGNASAHARTRDREARSAS